MAREKIHFVRSGSDCPIVRFSLGNRAAGYALVDTGSEITLVDESFVKENRGCFSLDVTGDKVVMHGVSGSNEKPIVKATAKVEFETKEGGIIYDIEAILCDLTHIKARGKYDEDVYPVTAVLGCDFLRENKAKINFINSQLSLEQ